MSMANYIFMLGAVLCSMFHACCVYDAFVSLSSSYLAIEYVPINVTVFVFVAVAVSLSVWYMYFELYFVLTLSSLAFIYYSYAL